jgi:quercetin 2,3-dioxygenase
MSIRPVKQVIQSKPTLEGAGVHLRRAFGFGNTKDFDPFLLLDDFRNDVPEDYLAGFPCILTGGLKPSPMFSQEL